MQPSNHTIMRPHDYLGKYTHWRGGLWQVIEVLDDPLSVVLQPLETTLTIQNNQYGEARRLAPSTTLLALYERDGVTPNAEFHALRFSDAPA
jgi:hypothetical protein